MPVSTLSNADFASRYLAAAARIRPAIDVLILEFEAIEALDEEVAEASNHADDCHLTAGCRFVEDELERIGL